MGWEGTVILRLLVDTQGNVAKVTVVTGSGFALLDESAVDAARHWRFEPAREGGRATAMVHEVRFRFRLDNAMG
jgi:protein TonB